PADGRPPVRQPRGRGSRRVVRQDSGWRRVPADAPPREDGCVMRAGPMNSRIAIQEEVTTPDGGGGFVKTWQTAFSVWAHWKHQSMYERLQAMQLQSGVVHRLEVRCRDDITPK